MIQYEIKVTRNKGKRSSRTESRSINNRRRADKFRRDNSFCFSHSLRFLSKSFQEHSSSICFSFSCLFLLNVWVLSRRQCQWCKKGSPVHFFCFCLSSYVNDAWNDAENTCCCFNPFFTSSLSRKNLQLLSVVCLDIFLLKHSTDLKWHFTDKDKEGKEISVKAVKLIEPRHWLQLSRLSAIQSKKLNNKRWKNHRNKSRCIQAARAQSGIGMKRLKLSLFLYFEKSQC